MSAKGAGVLAKTKTEGARKNQELFQRKRLPSGAQCISNILENFISQVEIVASLPAVLQLNDVFNVVDKELSKTLKEHQILDRRLETMEGLKQESDGEQEVVKAKAQLETDIKNSVRDLLRVVRAHPDVICGLRAETGMEVEESENILIRGLEKFHSHVVEKLLISLNEERQAVRHKRVSSPSAHDLEHIVSQEEEVTRAMTQIDAKISQINEEIKAQQSSLQDNMRQKAGTSFLADKQCQSHIETSKTKHISIQQEIDQLNSQLNNLILKNRQAVREIQEKNEMVETEIKYLRQAFDNETEENQANLELNTMGNEREEEELRKLEKPFSILEAKSNQIEEKRRLAEEKRKQDIIDLELKNKAAILAQAWWRGYSIRKTLKVKDKSKKAKKGKGKKKN